MANAEPGKYDDEAERIMAKYNAEMALLLVIGGRHGHGMSVCINANNPNAEEMGASVPRLLRHMADLIEKQGEFKQVPFPREEPRSWSDLASGTEDQGK